jgi:hypothetical protein
MKARNILLVAAAAFCLFSLSGVANAQDDADEGNIFTVTTLQWPFDNLDEIFTMLKEDQDIVEDNEYIISQKILVHRWAGDFSVMQVTEYASMADIDNAEEKTDALYEAKYPDEDEREARDAKLSELTGTTMHVDSILRENTSLTK